jgi:hypothetical protein
MDDDEKPAAISLAAERKQRERDFAQEREQMLAELSDIGLSPEKATAIATYVLQTDWLTLQATLILERWELDLTAEAVVRLVEIMRRSV